MKNPNNRNNITYAGNRRTMNWGEHMKILNFKVLTLVICALAPILLAEPPIPDHIMFGRLGLNCQIIEPEMGIRIEVQKTSNGNLLFSYEMGTDERDASQFVLRIPMSPTGQSEEWKAAPGEEVNLVVLDGDLQPLLQEPFIVGASTEFTYLDIGEGDSPPQAVAGVDQILCQNTTTLAANLPPIGAGQWEIMSGDGGSIDDINDPNSMFTGVMEETYLLQWSITHGTCPPSVDTVEIQFYEVLELAQAGPDLVSCTTEVQLAANVPVIGTGSWAVLSGQNGDFSSIFDPLATFYGEPGATYVLQWSVGNGICNDSLDDVNVEIVSLMGQEVSITGPGIVSCEEVVYLEAEPGFESYLWSTGETTRGIYTSQLGLTTYSVIGTTSNGCQSQAVHQVDFLPGDLNVAVFTGESEFTVCSLELPFILDALGLCGAGEPYSYEWILQNGDGFIENTQTAPTNFYAYETGNYLIELNVTDRAGTSYSTDLTLYAPVLEDFDLNGMIDENDWFYRLSFWTSDPDLSPYYLDQDQSGSISILDFLITQPCEVGD